MNRHSHRFKVGDIECVAVRDGDFSYGPPLFPPPAAFLFTNAPQGELLGDESTDSMWTSPTAAWSTPYVCLVIFSGDRVLLVDTGGGDLAPSTGRLTANLREEGIQPGDIDTVVITHGHPDHIGGLIDSTDRLRFPGARFIMSRGEWQFWTGARAERILHGPLTEVLLGTARKSLPPLAPRLELVDGNVEVAPGVNVFPAPGHTPGQLSLTVSSEDQELLALADVLLHPLHARHPGWTALVDLEPNQVEMTRETLLRRAADTGSLIFACHFPFPGLGHVTAEAAAWNWAGV